MDYRNLEGHTEGKIAGVDSFGPLAWRLLHQVGDTNHAVLQVRIATGKKHQIRKQLVEAKLGPIVGDLLYGYEGDRPAGFTSDGIMLHASYINFRDPAKNDLSRKYVDFPPWPKAYWPYQLYPHIPEWM